MKKITSLTILFLIFSLIPFLSGCSFDNEIQYDAVINITSEGNMEVTETFDIKYIGDYTVRYYDVGYQKWNQNNTIAHSSSDQSSLQPITNVLDHITVKQNDVELSKEHIDNYRSNASNVAFIGGTGDKDEQGTTIKAEINNAYCFFVCVPSGLDDITITYTYTILGVVTVYNDVSQINWRLFENLDGVVKNGTVTINLPKEAATDDLRCYARGGTGNINIVNDKQIKLDFKDISTDSFLEFRLLTNDIYDDIDSSHRYNGNVLNEILEYETIEAQKQNQRILIYNILFYGSFAILLIMLLAIIHVYRKYDKEYKATFDGKYLRKLPSEISPAEMSYLYHFGKIIDEDFTATLMDLIRRKYLTLDTGAEQVTSKDPDFKFILNTNQPQDELKSHEYVLINFIINQVGDGSCVSIKQIESFPKEYSNAMKFQNFSKSFQSACKNEGKKLKYIEPTTIKSKATIFVAIPTIYALICMVCYSRYTVDISFPIFVSILVTLIYIAYLGTVKRRTKLGNEEYAKWKAFKNFLEDFSKMEDYPIPGIVIWEHYLVYAISLEIADKVMDQLKVKLPKDVDVSEGTYLGYGYGRRGFYYGYYYGRINTTFRTAKTTMTNTVIQHNAQNASSGGRGGGFSGGSSFGGGGGGARVR